MKKFIVLANAVLVFALAIATLDIWKSLIITLSAGYLQFLPNQWSDKKDGK